jgi:CubicO group peptidase (beta-lactamase class C family)
VRALNLVADWPVDHVAAAVIRPGFEPVTIGDQDHLYRLASVSKLLVSWAVMVGVEERVVDLDQPAGQPGCTLRHLLAHAGGYPFEGTDPIAAPETTRIYSNRGFDLAAATLEEASGITIADYLDEAVLQPLGMSRTELRGSPSHAVWSTCDDMIRFAGEVLRPRLLATATAAEVARTQYPHLNGIVPGVGRFTPCPWGLGVEIAGEKEPHWTGRANSPATFGHIGGAGTMMWVDPTADVSLVALTDRPFDDWATTAIDSWRALSDAVLDEARS